MASWAADWTCETVSAPLHVPRSRQHFGETKYNAAHQKVGERGGEWAEGYS